MRKAWMVAAVLLVAGPAMADEVGLIKVSKGSVQVERDGRSMPAAVGMALQAADVIVTGADGSAGITFADNSLVSVGPEQLVLDRQVQLRLDHPRGRVRGHAQAGRLAAVSGKMVQAVARVDEDPHARPR